MAQNEWIGPANNGDAAAQYALGKMHQLGYINDFGQKVPQDDAVAASWFRKAAEQGHAEAPYNLGFMYAKGRGVAQDYVQVHMWFNIAASRLPPGKNRDTAVEGRDTVAKEMTPADISQARRLAKAWWVKHGKKR